MKPSFFIPINRYPSWLGRVSSVYDPGYLYILLFFRLKVYGG